MMRNSILVLLLAAAGVAASSLPSYSAGSDGGVAPRFPSAAGGLSSSIELPCNEVEWFSRGLCPVNLTADGKINHRPAVR